VAEVAFVYDDIVHVNLLAALKEPPRVPGLCLDLI
jgi:hypothetical protein